MSLVMMNSNLTEGIQGQGLNKYERLFFSPYKRSGGVL
jgi:hypothetical protein